MTYATVRAATNPELAYIRTQGGLSRLYLAFLKPPSVYTARLASVPSGMDRVAQISFTGGVGTLSNVKVGMTLYVGTTAGAYDLGYARIRKVPIAGTFYIGEESDILWSTVVSGGIYLTVVREHDLWAKHIVTVDDTTFYMDYDVAYSDQHVNFDPVPIMGSHRVLKLTDSTVSTQFNFSNSYCIDSSISSYSVSCPGSSSITGGSTSTPTITFDAPGWYGVYLTVTAANGKSFTGMRYVYVYSVSAMPAQVFQLGACHTDYDSGGWEFEVTIQDDVNLADVPERTLCILFAEDFYGNTQTSIGQLAGSENVICVGKIAEESISLNAEQSEVTLRIQGMQYWLQKVFAFPTGVLQTKVAATNWAEMYGPTVDKALFHLLHWGCTATAIMDVYLTNDTKYAAELSSPASNLWAQIQGIAFATIQARPGVDRFGRMFIEIDPQLVPLASRTWVTVMTLTKDDWDDDAIIQRVVVGPSGAINVSGVVVNIDATGNAFFAMSPGGVFKHYGDIEIVDRLLLSTQNLTNQLAGLIHAWRNNPYPSSEFKLWGNNRMIDCFPRQRISWSVSSGDSPRGISISGHFIPRRVEFTWNSDGGHLETYITLEMETQETQVNYTNGDVPGSASPNTPPPIPDFPPFPDSFPIILPTDITPVNVMPPHMWIHDSVGGNLYTLNFNSTCNWQMWNGGLTGGQYQSANIFFQTPNGTCYCGQGVETDAGWFARATAPGQPWTILFDQSSLADLGGAGWGVKGAWYNPLLPDTVGIVLRYNSTGTHFFLGVGGVFTMKAVVPDNDSFLKLVSFGLNFWILTHYGHGWKVTADGVTLSSPAYSDAGETYHQSRASSTGKIWLGLSGGGLIITENNMATGFKNTDGNIRFGVAGGGGGQTPYLDVDPTGQYLMTRYGTGERGRSYDAGYSWALMPGLLFQNNYYFQYLAGAGTGSFWAAAGGINIYVTQNFGDTWTANNGDLWSLIPVPNLDMIRKLV